MTLTAFCDSCGKKIRVGREYAGKKVKCLHCGHVLILPSRESFLSDPHEEFSKRSEERERDDEGVSPVDVRDMIDAAPPPPPDRVAEPAHAEAHAELEHVPRGDMTRGLMFGLGFWLAATPFIMIVVGLALVVFKLL